MAEEVAAGEAGRARKIARALMFMGRIVLGGMFLYAAQTKLFILHWAPFGIELRSWALFAMSVNSYQVLPQWAVLLVARTVPWLELALGLLLLTGYRLRYVAAAASTLLLLFFSVMLRSHLKGLGIDCGCFGFGEKLGPRTLARDGLLLAGSIALTVGAFLTSRRVSQVEPGPDAR